MKTIGQMMEMADVVIYELAENDMYYFKHQIPTHTKFGTVLYSFPLQGDWIVVKQNDPYSPDGTLAYTLDGSMVGIIDLKFQKLVDVGAAPKHATY